MDKKIKKSIFARIKQWLLNIFGLSKEEDGSNTKPASNDAGQESVDSPSTIAEKSAEEHTAPHSSNTEQTASNDDRRCDANNTNEEQVPIEEKIFKKVKFIEEYLALDKIASDSRAIDYSFITDEGVRCKLVANHIEMWRCYYGTRSHKQDFEQFCISVHMQAEALLRYWCYKKYTKEAALIAAQKKKSDITADKNGLLTYWALCVLFYDESSSDKDIFDTIRDLRNNIVHSTIDRPTKDVDEKAKTFIEEESVYLHYFCGIPTTVDSKIRSKDEYKKLNEINKGLRQFKDKENGLSKEEMLQQQELIVEKNLLEESAKNRKKRWDINIGVALIKYNDYLKLQSILCNTPYHEIICALKRMRDNIEIELKNV
jgi:hypothetical protein